MSPKAQQFINLQKQVNEQIDQHGTADDQLVSELDRLGDELTDAEIYEVGEWYNDEMQREMIQSEMDEWEDEY